MENKTGNLQRIMKDPALVALRKSEFKSYKYVKQIHRIGSLHQRLSMAAGKQIDEGSLHTIATCFVVAVRS